MRRKIITTVFLLVVAGGLAYYATGPLTSAAERQDMTADPELLFVHEVLPLLEAKCFACHGDDPDEIEGDFDIRSRPEMLEGGESGQPALVPGDPEASPIYIAATWADPDLEMPPKENDRLTETQTELLRQWIAGGAPWPNEQRRRDLIAQGEWDYSDGIQVETSGAESESWANRRYNPEDLWAFYPVESYEVPQPGRSLLDVILDREPEAVHPVDAFIDRKLEAQDALPADRADKRTLIRRATFDLTGLPPTPEEVEAFLADESPDAFEKLVDRLLASPRYGEQMARYWLDVTRYANSSGYSNDFARPNAWRYRDYVIRSFNEDKPYDRFVVEQIAGDELDPNDPEMLVAAGFLRMGPWEHTGMSVAAETRQLFLDDVTNSVGETFLSIPLRCASCHDHKFDPIPTKDYYRIQAAFAPVQFAEREVDYLPVENLEGFESGRERLQRRLDEAEAELEAIRKKAEDAIRAWYAERGLAYVPEEDRRDLAEDQRPPRFHGLTHQDLGRRKLLQKRIERLRVEMDRYEPLAFSVYNGPPVTQRSGRPMRVPDDLSGEPQEIFILTGGSVYAPDEQVSPGVLSAVRSLAEEGEPVVPDSIPATMDGRRLALARWIASPENPLSTRSIVNRVWQMHFGRGLAGNPNNFGVMGKRPTHPELLDWLTGYFLEHGWSIKTLHRLIMMSDAYQRASSHPEMNELREIDPNNELLAYFTPRRLTAEELRDVMLYVSGELNLEMGGLPARPEINMEVALQPRHVMGSVAAAYQPSRTPEERNRRTIYAQRLRGLPDPMLEVFNQPSADLSCERRTASTVTPQVFTLFNGQNSYDRALAMARRLEEEAATPRARIERAVRLAWNRPATPEEVDRALDHLATMTAHHRENPPVRQEYPTEVKREMFEEMTGEPFSFTERLDIYENYVPDVKPWDVEPETRALADLCLVLFNANEFVYVY